MFYMVEPQAIEFCNMVIIEGVIDLTSILATAHQPQLTESAQLVRHRRLAHSELSRDIANIQFTIEQDGNNPQAGGIAESAKQVSKVGGGMFP